jgi:hypothetical protein
MLVGHVHARGAMPHQEFYLWNKVSKHLLALLMVPLAAPAGARFPVIPITLAGSSVGRSTSERLAKKKE